MVLNFVPRAVTECPKLITAAEYALKYRAVANKFRFEKIGEKHLPELMDLSKGFFEDESLTVATGSTIDNCRKGMEHVFQYSIAAQCVVNQNEICYENATNKPIGFRLANPAYRDPKKAPFFIPEPTLSQQEITLFTPLDETFDKIWDIFPDEQVIMKAELIYVDRKYRRDGLFQTWCDYGMHFPTMAEQSGARIYAALCTARATKHWFAKLGYSLSCTSKPYVKNTSGDEVILPQGDIHVYTTDLTTTTAVDVKPFWRAMGLL